MGKCVSKQTSATDPAGTELSSTTEIRRYSINSDYIRIYSEDNNDDYDITNYFHYNGVDHRAKKKPNKTKYGQKSELLNGVTNSETEVDIDANANNTSTLIKSYWNRNADCGLNNEGQSESKKGSKKAAGPETKGTAMSFGFRRKFHSSNKKNSNIIGKDQDKLGDTIDYSEKYHSATVISNPGLVKTDDINSTSINSDKNGNSGNESSSSSVSTEKNENKRITLRRWEPGVGGGAPHKNNRFGFKQSNVVRPASAGLTPKMTDFEENIENNNVTDKRRSKSALGVKTSGSVASSNNRYQTIDNAFDDHRISVPKISSTSAPTSKLGSNASPAVLGASTATATQQTTTNQSWEHYERKTAAASEALKANSTNRPPSQYTIINSGIHTNVIVKPTPQPAASVTRFTLHTTSLPKPQYPVPISLSTTSSTSSRNNIMDTKNAKQVANNCRKGFYGPREISTDSGIASLGNNYDTSNGGSNNTAGIGINTSLDGGSPRRSRNRPRNLEMVLNARHKFDVRDLDDTLSCDSIEPLALPKLPSVFSSNNQTVPLNGLVRSTINQSQDETDLANTLRDGTPGFCKVIRAPLSDTESIDEEKLFRDRSTSEKGNKNPSIKDYNSSSKNSSPGSSRASWCNAGESLAIKDCSSFSLSSSDDSKDNQNEKITTDVPSNDENISSITFSENPSLLSSSYTATVPKNINIAPIAEKQTRLEPLQLQLQSHSLLQQHHQHQSQQQQHQEQQQQKQQDLNHNQSILANIAESKFAEMAATVTDVLLDDETSPTDSLVSSTESDEVLMKKNKKKPVDSIPEKDIDEISPELEVCSPMSPGTPTHASNSLSLSDGGRDFLIDDEIADQPALMFSDKADAIDAAQILHSGTPTLMESLSTRSSIHLPKPKAIVPPSLELSLKTPIARRRISHLSRAESLDTLSPCESIASDDLMMDFDAHSSIDSIDRLSQSIRSRSGSALLAMDDAQLWSELEAKSTEWNNIIKVRSSKDSIFSQLPARATRLLNRSRLQQSQLSNTGSDSPKSTDSLPRKTSSRTASLHLSGRDPNSSCDDLFFHDKSFRNSMIQDVLYFKKQLIRLRRILQEQHQDEESLTRTDTLNPFELGNGQFFASCGLDSNQFSDDKDLGSLTSSTTIDEHKQELADLRRQVVYLQGQVDDRDRTIRLQKNLIDKLEAEKDQIQTVSVSTSISEKECVNTATQTERVRPLSMGPEGLARSKPECISYTSYTPTSTNPSGTSAVTTSPTRRHTVISTTLTNVNHLSQVPTPIRRASLGWEKYQYKPVKTTLIGEPIAILDSNIAKPTITTATNGCSNSINGKNIVKQNGCNGSSSFNTNRLNNSTNKNSSKSNGSTTSSNCNGNSISEIPKTNGVKRYNGLINNGLQHYDMPITNQSRSQKTNGIHGLSTNGHSRSVGNLNQNSLSITLNGNSTRSNSSNSNSNSNSNSSSSSSSSSSSNNNGNITGSNKFNDINIDHHRSPTITIV